MKNGVVVKAPSRGNVKEYKKAILAILDSKVGELLKVKALKALNKGVRCGGHTITHSTFQG